MLAHQLFCYELLICIIGLLIIFLRFENVLVLAIIRPSCGTEVCTLLHFGSAGLVYGSYKVKYNKSSVAKKCGASQRRLDGLSR